MPFCNIHACAGDRSCAGPFRALKLLRSLVERLFVSLSGSVTSPMEIGKPLFEKPRVCLSPQGKSYLPIQWNSKSRFKSLAGEGTRYSRRRSMRERLRSKVQLAWHSWWREWRKSRAASFRVSPPSYRTWRKAITASSSAAVQAGLRTNQIRLTRFTGDSEMPATMFRKRSDRGDIAR